MSGLKTQIEIGADASGVEAGVNQAKRSLAGLGQAATAAGKAGADGLGQIGTGADTSAKSVERATKSIVSQIQRAQLDIATAGKSMSESLQIKADFKGVDPAVIAPYIAQLKAAEQAQIAATKGLGSMEMSAKATSAALRGVPAQFTDIVTSLQGGQAPLTVLLQQGGQLKDMFGGAGNAARALGGYIGGLVTNPVVLVTAAVGALGYAAYSASNDAKQLRDTVTLTGGAAGVSAGQLQSMAASVGLNATALNEFAKSGSVGADNIERVTAASIRLERLGGPAVSKMVDAYESLKRTPLEASVALNEKTNYLTASLYAQIKALQERGRHLEAAKLAQDAFAQSQARMADGLEAGLGPVDRAWLSIRQNIEGAWKAVKGFAGSEIPLPDRVAAQKKVVADLQKTVDAPPSLTTNYVELPAIKEQLKLEKERLFILQSSASVIAGSAAEKAKQNELEKAQMAWRDQVDASRPNREKRDIEIDAARNRGAAANAPQSVIDKQVALVNQKYDTGASIAAVKQAEDAKLQIIARAQDQINTLRATGQLTEIGQITATTEQTVKAIDVRRNALIAERAIIAGRQDTEREVVALDTQIAALSQERATAQAKGLNEVSVAWYRQKQAIQATYEAMKAEDNMALVNEQIRLDQIAKGVADTFRDQAVAMQGVARQTALEVSLIGATDQERSLGLEKLRIQLDLEKKIAELNRTDFKSQEDRAKAIATATEQAAEQAAQASTNITVKYWAGAVRDIKSNLSDGIISSIKNNNVQGAIRGVRDAFVNAFDRLVVRPIIDPIMGSAAQVIAGWFGVSPQGSPNSGLPSAVAGAGSLAGTGSKIWDWLTGGGGPAASGGNVDKSILFGTGYGTTGAEAAGSLFSGAGAMIGKALPWIGGAALLKSLTDYKIDARGNGITANLGSNGIAGGKASTYAEFQQTGGLFGGGTTINRDWSVADKGVSDYITTNVQAITSSNKAYAKALGLTTDAVDAFTKNIEINLTGLDAAGQKKAIDSALSQFAGEQAAAAFGPVFASVAKEGENTSQTMARLVTDFTTVNQGLDLLGFSVLKVGVDGATTAAGLVDAFGGVDKAQAAATAFYDKFYSDGEKAANSAASLNASFTALGVSAPATREQFRQLVAGIDITTESGQKLVAGILALSPAFDAAASASEAAAARMASVIGDYASSSEVRAFTVAQIQKGLADGGVNLTVDQIGNASRGDARALYEQLVAQGNTRGADAVLAQAKAFAGITTAPVNAQGGASAGSSGGGSSAASTGLTDWQKATQAIVDTMRDLRETLLGNGPDSFARTQAQFAIEVAQAQAGNLAAYQDLPNIAKLLAKSGESNSKTALEQSLLVGYIVDSLGRVSGSPTSGSTLSVAKGQEAAYVPPARTYNAVDTTALVGGDNTAMVAALRAMALRLDAIEANTGRGAGAGEKLDRRLALAMPNTNALQVNVVTP